MPARSRRDVDLTTPTARGRLKPLANRKPHWRFIAEGRYLGYRRHEGNRDAGSWCARFYDPQRARYVERRLAAADDGVPADGESVLSYRQALERAMTWADDQERRSRGLAPEERGPYTVARCMADYLEWYALHREALKPTRYAIAAHILPPLGGLQVAELTLARLKRWHQELASQPPRRRSKAGEAPRYADRTGDPEELRRRKAAANRILTILKAALNHAFNEGRGGLVTDGPWRKVKPFRGVDAPKVRFLTGEEIRRLVNSCDDDFRLLVQAALHTGARYGDLRRARVRDYLVDSRSLYIPRAKSGKERHVFLSDEGVAFFEEQTAGRRGDELVFRRREDQAVPERVSRLEAWGESHQHRRMRDACAAAEIWPPVSFHILRHTYASHYLMSGGSIPGLAQQLGHSDTRMTVRHYGHLADSWRSEEARKHAHAFGQKSPGVVRRLGSG